MIMLPMTLGDPYPLKTTPISTFCIAFRVFLMGGLRDFKFGRQVDNIKSQPKVDTPSMKKVWSCRVTNF